MSSPYDSRSNGKTETAVKIVKKLFKRSTDPYLALLEWRNTPTAGLDSMFNGPADQRGGAICPWHPGKH